MNLYPDTPDTTVWLDSIPAGSGPGISYTRCGCVLPASCEDCDGSSAERAEMWRMPRSERLALELRNRRLDPHWRALHGEDDGRGVA